MMNQRNYGFHPDVQKDEDYLLGGSSPLPIEVLQANQDWTLFLPKKEFQNLNAIEPYACVSFTILNCVEILIKRKYGIETNWSDRFLAANSGTKEGGNSPNVVCEFLRKLGVVPQEFWPFDGAITSFEKFYEPIPENLKELAKEFNEQWLFRYENVPLHLIDVALTYSPLLVSVPAWFEKDGYYYRPDGMQDNHATTYIKKGFEYRLVFDSYDSELKKVHLSVQPQTIKRFWIEKRTDNLKTQVSILTQIVELLKKVLSLRILLNSYGWRKLAAWWDYEKTLGAARSPQWSKTKREFEKLHPKVCAFCGGAEDVQCHHKIPFNKRPELENDLSNLIWLCEAKNRNCHLNAGHLNSFRSWNETIEEDAVYWKSKVENRP